MTNPYKCGLLYFFILFSCLAATNAQKLAVAKPYAWVTQNPTDYTRKNLDAEGEDGYIDLLYERQTSLAQQAVFTKRAFKILTDAGVQNNSEISVNFDEGYNQLVFHAITIIRDGVSIDKLQPSKFKMVRQEKDLSRHLYDGGISAVLFLEDVRKGDIVEYSYTVKGFNPIFKNKFTQSLPVNFSYPFYNVYYKLIVPTGRVLQIKNTGKETPAKVQKIGNETVYEWDLKDLPSLRVQDKTPSWYNPYNYLQVTEFASWDEVDNWARGLFPQNVPLSAALQKQVAVFSNADTTQKGKTLASLRFVQDEIRYMGIEMGQHSHLPHNPTQVLQQRFGDCKDKSYLLCSLLNAMGIEASPVLINTEDKKSLKGWLPSASAFDHVTVRVKLDDKFYWFDPTIAGQRGDIADIDYPDYQCGLVIGDTAQGLTDIPLQQKGKVKIKEAFDIPAFGGKAKFTVNTVYTGSFADGVRDALNNNSRFEMQKDYKDFYAFYFEKIESDSIAFTDNEKTGVLEMKEYYTIPDIWEKSGSGKEMYFTSFVINSIVNKPKDINRTMPFSISFPANYSEQVEVKLPEEWNATESSDFIKSAAFDMGMEFSYSNKRIVLKYDYKSHKDFVNPDEAEEYFAKYKKMDDNNGYSISQGDNSVSSKTMSSAGNGTSRSNIAYLFVAVFVLVGGMIWWSQRG